MLSVAVSRIGFMFNTVLYKASACLVKNLKYNIVQVRNALHDKEGLLLKRESRKMLRHHRQCKAWRSFSKYKVSLNKCKSTIKKKKERFRQTGSRPFIFTSTGLVNGKQFWPHLRRMRRRSMAAPISRAEWFHHFRCLFGNGVTGSSESSITSGEDFHTHHDENIDNENDDQVLFNSPQRN